MDLRPVLSVSNPRMSWGRFTEEITESEICLEPKQPQPFWEGGKETFPQWRQSHGSLGKFLPTAPPPPADPLWPLQSSPVLPLPQVCLQLPGSQEWGSSPSSEAALLPTLCGVYFRINALPPPQALLGHCLPAGSLPEHYVHHPKAQDSSFWLFPNQGLSINQVTGKTMPCYFTIGHRKPTLQL